MRLELEIESANQTKETNRSNESEFKMEKKFNGKKH